MLKRQEAIGADIGGWRTSIPAISEWPDVAVSVGSGQISRGGRLIDVGGGHPHAFVFLSQIRQNQPETDEALAAFVSP